MCGAAARERGSSATPSIDYSYYGIGALYIYKLESDLFSSFSLVNYAQKILKNWDFIGN